MVDEQQGAGVESVWDYSRPPAVRTLPCHVEVLSGGVLIVDTDDVVQVLETSHPPTVYLRRENFADGVLVPADGMSWCEFKGQAGYVDAVAGAQSAPRAGWYYPDPSPGYELLQDRVAIYPGLMDECRVDGETVRAQAGNFYGGWITSRVAGPFKGEPGTLGW